MAVIIPQYAWIIASLGVVVALLMLAFFLGELLQYLSWAVFIAALVFGLGVLISLYGTVKKSAKESLKKGGENNANSNR